MAVRAAEGDVKVNVSSSGFLGEALSESKGVKVTSKAVSGDMSTWALTLAAAGWYCVASSTATRGSTKVLRPAAQTVAQGATRAEARRVENLMVLAISPPPLLPACLT